MVKLRRRRFKHGRPSHRQEFPYHPSHYSVRAQQTPALSTPQQSVRWIARSRDGKFIVDGLATGGSSSSSDEGGFLAAPPRPPPPNWKSYEPVQTGVYHVGGSRSHPWNPFADVSETSDRSEPSLFVTPIHTIFTPDGRRFRASSPGPSKQLRSLRNLNELSSVHYPSSVERSFPSTIRSRPTPQSTSMRRIQEEYEFPAAFSPQLYTTWTPLSTKSFQHQVQVEVHHDPHHLPGIPYHTAPPTAAPPPIFYPYPPYPYVLPYPYPPYYHPAYSIEVHSPPTSPRGTGHLVPPRIPDISPPKPVPIYENIRVTQRPLATSSPPRRRRGKPPLPLSPPEFRPLPKPPVQALADTREKIQDAIGRLKHQRHNSAPELGVSPGSRAGDSGLDSSSGFGSKNTSSQPTQSSSGFEASPPSLDTSLSRRLHSSPQLLDASVDDPYEFDSIHTGDDTTAPQSVSPRHFQARRSLGGGNASDSEMYTRSSDKVGGTFLEEEPPEPADLEARVRAMKAEFQQYRQKQAARKRTGTILESAC